ncbi:hypothetical protein AAFF_G00302800 [Aldrovandia affinis]|uniref:Cadherin domain-containing protein n=1 Tax=Aldrovandia affinis TaxID=143900 RepID=A0AAD7W107_9TELE|nr:hypothetical protein AAFF_G00302800 [Aldrovandia affinis]
MNDHSPDFPQREKHLEIAESTLQGARFALESARDPDVGINTLRFYRLSQNENFDLEVKNRGEDKIPFLILKKPLDREKEPKLNLVLTAYDGGKPERSGSVNIIVNVIDINDNAPVFDRQVYTIVLQENVPLDTSVVRVHATDLDDGANREIVYTFDNSVRNKAFELFQLDANTGELTVKGLIDFEETSVYEFDVQATDKGQVTLTGDCSVIINIKDVNDNAPEIEVTSLSSHVAEDANPDSGTPSLSSNVTVNVFILDQNDNAPVILSPVSANGSAEGVEEIPRNVNAGHSVTKVRAYDADIGYNAWLSFSLQHATDSSLFSLERYSGHIRMLRSFTETDEAEHKLVIVVKTMGTFHFQLQQL